MFWRKRARLGEELEHHVAAETADNVGRGMSPEAARTAALRTVGNVQSAQERARELDPLYWLDTLWQDVRFACRLIGRNRWTSVTIVATLALGIGLNVSVFSLLNGLLLRPWISHEPETVIGVFPRFSGQYQLRFSDGGKISQPDYAFYRDHTKTMRTLAASRFVGGTLSGVEAGTIPIVLVTCNVFAVTGGAPILGRHLTEADCAKEHETPVVVLGEAAWRTRFNADPQIVGRTIYLNRIPFAVVGVAQSFVLLSGSPSVGEVYVPYTMLSTLRPEDDFFADRTAHWLTPLGRRKAEYSLEQVQQEMNVLSAQVDRNAPGRTTSLLITDGSMIQNPGIRRLAPLLIGITLGTATLLLVLGCVNVTTLLLARAAARQREIAVRLSMGADRFRLLRQLVTEGLVLSTAAAGFSFLMAQWTPRALWYSLLKIEPLVDLSPDWRVLGYCVGVALAVGVFASLSPAFESLRPELAQTLKTSGAVTGGQKRSRLRGTLVAVQVALSLLVLMLATFFTQAQRQIVTYHPGFETAQVVGVTLSSVAAGFVPPPSFYAELEARVRAMPGVVGFSYASTAPWAGRSSAAIREIDGRPFPDTRDFRLDPANRRVSPEFFALLGLPMTLGRTLTAADGPEATVISEAMAQRYWPGQNPLGHRFNDGYPHEVVGVSRNVHSLSFLRDDGPIYHSPEKADARHRHVLVRVSGDPQAAAAATRRIVLELDPQMAVTATTLGSLVEEQAERMQPLMLHATLAGTLALVLALSGVYSVVAFSVRQRVRELGIRLALGAQRGDVIWLVVRSGSAPVLAGLVAGLAVAAALFSGLEAILFGLNPRDPLTLAAVALSLFAAALVAIWIPARRASGLDPVSSLRIE